MDVAGHELERHRAPFMMKEMREAILAEEQNSHNPVSYTHLTLPTKA